MLHHPCVGFIVLSYQYFCKCEVQHRSCLNTKHRSFMQIHYDWLFEEQERKMTTYGLGPTPHISLSPEKILPQMDTTIQTNQGKKIEKEENNE